MKEEVFAKIVDRYWGSVKSLLLVIPVSCLLAVKLIVGIVQAFHSTEIEIKSSGLSLGSVVIVLTIIAVICVVVAVSWYIIIVYEENHIRKPQKGKTGILIYIDAESKKDYEEMVRKFGKEFKKKVINEFDVIFVPFGVAVDDGKDSKRATDYLLKRSCVLLLRVTINSDKNMDNTTYDMTLNATIIHRYYEENVKEEFKHNFDIILSKFREIRYDSKNMVRKLRVTAGDLSYACEYIIGLSFFLNGFFKIAESVLGKLILELPDNDEWANISKSICVMRFKMFLMLAEGYCDKYSRQCSDLAALEKMNEFLEKANECIPRTEQYYINKAYYSVAKFSDIREASKYVNLCKQVAPNSQNLKYSIAFIKAYNNSTPSAIASSYKSALKTPYNLQDLIIFIEAVLEKEKNHDGLKLALAILYNASGDKKLADEYYNTYLETVQDKEKVKEILFRKGVIS